MARSHSEEYVGWEVYLQPPLETITCHILQLRVEMEGTPPDSQDVQIIINLTFCALEYRWHSGLLPSNLHGKARWGAQLPVCSPAPSRLESSVGFRGCVPSRDPYHP